MSLTKEDVDKFSKSYQCFSKLLILYPMIHPATIHGLLVEFDYDYGFVMQLILKLESQRNALYWDEVARVSQIMEQQNRARMNLYADPSSTNQRHIQMMSHHMFNSISSYGESSSSTLPISSLMEAPQQQSYESSFDHSMETHVGLVENQHFSQNEYNNSNLALNNAMQMAHEMAEQRSGSNSLHSIVDGVVENNSSPPINVTMVVDEQQATPAYPDANIMGPHSAERMEPDANYSYPASSNINWQMNAPEKNPKARPPQTYSNPNVEPRITGFIRNENNQTVYIHPAHNNDWKIYELMEAAKSQMARFYANSNNTYFQTARAPENQSQSYYSYSTPNWQSDNTEEALNLQTTQSQLYSNNSNSRPIENQFPQDNHTNYSSNWHNKGYREEAHNLQISGSELHINNTDCRFLDGTKNNFNQTIYIDPTSDNDLQNIGIRETPQRTQTQLYSNTYFNIIEPVDNQRIQRYYANQTPLKSTSQINRMWETAQPQHYINPNLKTAVLVEKPINRMNYTSSALNNIDWQIIELKDFSNMQTAQSQYQNNSGNSAVHQISEIIEVPVIGTTNTHICSSSFMNTSLMMKPLNESNQSKSTLRNSNWHFGDTVVPKILLHSEPLANSNNRVNTEHQINPNNSQSTEALPKRRVRKQKLKELKSTSEVVIPESTICKIMETPARKPVKRHSKNNKSELPFKRLRKDEKLIKPSLGSKSAKLEKNVLKDKHTRGTNKLRSNTIKQQNKQVIQLEEKQNKKKENQKLQPIKLRATSKNTKSKQKEKKKNIKKEPEAKNFVSQAKKVKKIKNQMNKKIVAKLKAIKNKKSETSKSQSKRNKAKASKAPRRNNFEIFTSGTDFFNVDPHITKIENTPEGQLITVRPKLNSLEGVDDSSSDVQFIRRFHPNNKRKYTKTKKSEPSTPKKQKRSAAESKKSDSKLCKTTVKPKVQKCKPQSKRQAAISNSVPSIAKSQDSKVTPKNRKGIKGRSGATLGTESRKKEKTPKFPTGEGSSRAQKVPKGSILCCCQSIGFRKKYKLPPFDKDDNDDLYPDEILFPPEEIKPKGDEPFDPARETLFEYYDRNPNADQDIRKYFAKKREKMLKTTVKRDYNTRSKKEKKM